MVTGKSTPRRRSVRRFTETWLRDQLGKQRPAREEWGDTDKPGLRARFGKSGTITFVHYRSAGGKQAMTILGRYPDLGLAAARERLDDERTRARLGLTGIDISAADEDTTVEALVERFCVSLKSHRKHPGRARLNLKRLVLERRHGFRYLKASAVARPAWRAIIEELADTPGAASTAYRLIRQMFNFGVQVGALESSPFQGLTARAVGAEAAPPRQRTLTVEELRAFLDVLDTPCRPEARAARHALRLLLLTGKRTGELLRARWADLDLKAGTWTIPGANRKGPLRRPLPDEVVPLSGRAVEVFRSLEKLRVKDSPWTFPSPIGSASGHLADNSTSQAVRELFDAEALTGERWHPHDLRRTARSCWSEKLGAPWDLCERLLGHALPQVAATYDTGAYQDQRRAVLDRWAVYLDQVQAGGGDVAFIAGGRR